MVAKVAGGIIGLGLLGAGGIAVTKPHWFGMDYMPSWKPLSKDTNYSTAKTSDYGDGKFGNKKGNYLTGVIGNESWWEWSFRNLKTDNPPTKGKFKYEGKKTSDAVTMAYDKDEKNGKALNQVCKAAYKTTSTDVVGTEDENKFMKSDVWKYCSPLGKEPTTINSVEKGIYTGKIGSTENSDFISVIDEDNDMFWLIRDKEIRGSDKDNFEKVPESVNSAHFNDAKTSLKELCRRAYLTDKPGDSGTSKPSVDDTKKYCKLEIS